MPQPVEFASRLLFPFRFGLAEEHEGWRAFDPDVLATLSDHRLDPRGKGEPVKVWERVEVLEDEEARGIDKGGLYPEEMLPQVAAFFFRPSGQRSGRYFRMRSDCQNRILNGEYNLWPEGRERGLEELRKPEAQWIRSKLPRKIDQISSAELFITGFGVGVLSLTIRGNCSNQGMTCKALCELLYRVSQKRGFRAPTLARVHPADDPLGWKAKPEEIRARVEAENPCDPHAPVEERLGSRGGEVKLVELCRALLGPLADADPEIRTRYKLPVYDDSYQRQLAHFTVVLFESDVEFSDSKPHPQLIHELSALTQLEESNHAGMKSGEISVPWKVLNCKHLAGAGAQGSVHFVANQHVPPSGFDHTRVRLVLDKYFMDFLLVYVQDQYLFFAARQCGELVEPVASSLDRTFLPDFTKLRSEVLAFKSLCFVPKISQRNAHNRYYRLVMRALGVTSSLEDVASQLSDLDAACKFEIQEKTRREMRDLAKAQNRTQQKLEWVEIFVVAAYSVYLINYIGKNFQFDYEYIAWSIVGGSLTAAGLTAWLLRPWSHAESPTTGPWARLGGISRKWYFVVIFVALVATSYIGCGKRWFSHAPVSAHDAHEEVILEESTR